MNPIAADVKDKEHIRDAVEHSPVGCGADLKIWPKNWAI